MKIFSKIRSSYGEKMLVNKAKTLVRQKQFHNFNTAKTVGVLFNAGNTDDLQLIKAFCKELSIQKIETFALGYLNADSISNDLLFLGNISIFCNKDLDFFFRPTNKDAVEFMTKKFDIFFDLCVSETFPQKYISSLSPAVFKVGRFNQGNTSLDMMIDINSQPNLAYLIEQVRNYVSLLNNQKA